MALCGLGLAMSIAPIGSHALSGKEAKKMTFDFRCGLRAFLRTDTADTTIVLHV